MFKTKKPLDNRVIRNRFGQVRSGWIILAVMASYYLITFSLSDLLMFGLRQHLISTGDIVPATGYYSPLIDQLDDVVLPIVTQFLTDVIMIAIPVFTWRFLMKHTLPQMGLTPIKTGYRECFVGMAWGIFSCSLIFVALLLLGQARVESLVPTFSPLQLWWLFLFVLVAFAEEILNRGFLMSTLRRTRSIYLIMAIPSVIFGLIHLLNPSVTFLSVLNIILIGLFFSYVFVKSGNIWMCIGFHFTWNTFQGIVYGIPVSGLNIVGILHTDFVSNTLINGGEFGMEGGLLTTVVSILSILFARYYYRNSTYHFITDSHEPSKDPLSGK